MLKENQVDNNRNIKNEEKKRSKIMLFKKQQQKSNKQSSLFIYLFTIALSGFFFLQTK